MANTPSKRADFYRRAEKIAGAIIEDDDAPEDMLMSERIERAAAWSNMGTDGDLTPSERARLRKLAEKAKRAGV